MYSYGPPHMAVQKQDDQHEHTFSSCVRIRDVVLKTYLGRWTIGRSGERGSGMSVLPARYDDDDDCIIIEGCPRGVMVKSMDNRIVVIEFVLQSRYYVHFRANTLGKGMNPFILPAIGLNSTTTVLLGEWLWQIPLGKVWTPLSSQLWVK